MTFSFINSFVFSKHIILVRATVDLESIPGTLATGQEYTDVSITGHQKHTLTGTWRKFIQIYPNLSWVAILSRKKTPSTTCCTTMPSTGNILHEGYVSGFGLITTASENKRDHSLDISVVHDAFICIHVNIF